MVTPDWYLDVTSLVRGLRDTGMALFFSDGANGGLKQSSVDFLSATAPGGSILQSSIHNTIKNKPYWDLFTQERYLFALTTAPRIQSATKCKKKGTKVRRTRHKETDRS